MKATALMIAGPIISAIGLYFRFRKKPVTLWLESRRLDQTERVDTAICPECGGGMKRRTYQSGHRKGSSALVCNSFPDCKNVKWG